MKKQQQQQLYPSPCWGTLMVLQFHHWFKKHVIFRVLCFHRKVRPGSSLRIKPMLDAVISMTQEAGKHEWGGFFSPLALGHLEATAGKLGWAATPSSTGSQENGLLQAAKSYFQPSLNWTRLMEKLLLNAWNRGQFTQNFSFSTGIFHMLIIIKMFKHFWKVPAWVPSNKILLVSLHEALE